MWISAGVARERSGTRGGLRGAHGERLGGSPGRKSERGTPRHFLRAITVAKTITTVTFSNLTPPYQRATQANASMAPRSRALPRAREVVQTKTNVPASIIRLTQRYKSHPQSECLACCRFPERSRLHLCLSWWCVVYALIERDKRQVADSEPGMVRTRRGPNQRTIALTLERLRSNDGGFSTRCDTDSPGNFVCTMHTCTSLIIYSYMILWVIAFPFHKLCGHP